MSDPESYRSSHLNRGGDYHAEFSTNPRRALMWEMERRVLREIVERDLRPGRFRHLDFACGTGRIIGLLKPMAAQSVGVDLSPTMLEVARNQVAGARFLEVDITSNDVLGDEKFDLVTAFRFFPNAEPALRDAAMSVLARHVAPDGLVVFNNHCHTGGLNRRVVRLVKGPGLRLNDMSRAECEDLSARHGLMIQKVHHMGVLPDYESRLLRPRVLVRVIERAGRHLPLASIAENLIFVCRRAQQGC